MTGLEHISTIIDRLIDDLEEPPQEGGFSVSKETP